MYNVNANPLEEKLKERIETTNWNELPPILAGFDVYVDIDGNVGFYEGNSSPFALGDYGGMFGDDLNQAIAGELKKRGAVGININPETEKKGCRRHNASIAINICQTYGLKCIVGRNSELRWDKKMGFYFEKEGKKRKFDILFNRNPSAWKTLTEKIPEEYWDRAQIMSPLQHTLILRDKNKTIKALTSFGLNTPLSYVAKNPYQRKVAMRKIMGHIEKNHPNYQPPFIFIKPVCGTGARKIRVLRDADSRPSYPIKYPCLVGERITVAGYENTHSVDTRMFYCGGYASHGIGRVAPLSIEQAKIDDGKAFKKSAFITNLCQGGDATRLDVELENILKDYVLAAVLAIDEHAKGA